MEGQASHGGACFLSLVVLLHPTHVRDIGLHVRLAGKDKTSCLPYAEEDVSVPAAHVGHQP